MKDELQNAMDRAKKYDNIDGTGEMAMGLVLLGFALLGYLMAYQRVALSEHPLWKNGMLGFLLMIVGFILIPVLVQWFCLMVKRRITWPRTGYVAFRRDGKPLRLKFTIAVVVAVVAIVAGVSAYLIAHRHYGATSIGRIIYLGWWAPLYAMWVFRMEREHLWKWLIVLLMALGLVVISLIVPGGGVFDLLPPVMSYVGLMWIISGGVTLALYLRHAPPPVREAE